MIGRGPDPEHVVKRTRERCAVALVGNHDYGATGSVDASRFGEPGSAAVWSIELAAQRLTGADIDWLRARKPAAHRDGVQCWHASPRNAVHEYVGAANAAACLTVQRAQLGLVAHTHQAAAWQQTPAGARRARIAPGEPLDISTGRWLLNPGAVGARHHRGCAGGTRWTSRPPTGPLGCCWTWRAVPRSGAAHPTIRRRPARAHGRSGSMTAINRRQATRGRSPARCRRGRGRAPWRTPSEYITRSSWSPRQRPRSGHGDRRGRSSAPSCARARVLHAIDRVVPGKRPHPQGNLKRARRQRRGPQRTYGPRTSASRATEQIEALTLALHRLAILSATPKPRSSRRVPP